MEQELSSKHSRSTHQDDLLVFQSYQNGLYNGYTHKAICHGKGVFWWDSGELYFGEWHEAKIHGEGILFFPYGGYLKGFFFKNKINGAAFLKFPNGDFYEGIWRHGKLDGKCFKYFAAANRWALCTYSKGVFQNCLNKGSGQPNISFEEKLSMQIESTFVEHANDRVGVIYYKDGGKYYGVIQEGMPQGLGITQYSDGKFDAGLYQNGLLQGMGRLIMENGDICEGNIQEGQIRGRGFFYKKDIDTWVFGNFKGQNQLEVITKGKGFPLEEIIEWKRTVSNVNLPVADLVIPNDLFYIPLLQAPTEDPRARMKRSPVKSNSRSPNSSSMRRDSSEKINHNVEEYRQLLKFKIAKFDSNRSSKFKQEILETNNEDDDYGDEVDPENTKFEKNLESEFQALEKKESGPKKNQNNDKEQISDDLWQGVTGDEYRQQQGANIKGTEQSKNAHILISSAGSNKLKEGSPKTEYIYKKVDSPSPKLAIPRLEGSGQKKDAELKPQSEPGSKRQNRGGPSFDVSAGDGSDFFVAERDAAEQRNIDRDQIPGDNLQSNPENPFRPNPVYTPRGIERKTAELDSPDFSKVKPVKQEAGNDQPRQRPSAMSIHHRAQSAQQEGTQEEQEDDDYSIQSISRSEMNLPNRHRYSSSSKGVTPKPNNDRKNTIDEYFSEIQSQKEAPVKQEEYQVKSDQPQIGESDEKQDSGALTFRKNNNQSNPTIEEGPAGWESREEVSVEQKPLETDNSEQNEGLSENGVLANLKIISEGDDISKNMSSKQGNTGEVLPYERDYSFGNKLIGKAQDSSKEEQSDDKIIEGSEQKVEMSDAFRQRESFSPSKGSFQENQNQNKVVEEQIVIKGTDSGNVRVENESPSNKYAYKGNLSSPSKEAPQEKQSQNKIVQEQGFIKEDPVQMSSGNLKPENESPSSKYSYKDKLPSPSKEASQRNQDQHKMAEGQGFIIKGAPIQTESGNLIPENQRGSDKYISQAKLQSPSKEASQENQNQNRIVEEQGIIKQDPLQMNSGNLKPENQRGSDMYISQAKLQSPSKEGSEENQNQNRIVEEQGIIKQDPIQLNSGNLKPVNERRSDEYISQAKIRSPSKEGSQENQNQNRIVEEQGIIKQDPLQTDSGNLKPENQRGSDKYISQAKLQSPSKEVSQDNQNQNKGVEGQEFIKGNPIQTDSGNLKPENKRRIDEYISQAKIQSPSKEASQENQKPIVEQQGFIQLTPVQTESGNRKPENESPSAKHEEKQKLPSPKREQNKKSQNPDLPEGISTQAQNTGSLPTGSSTTPKNIQSSVQEKQSKQPLPSYTGSVYLKQYNNQSKPIPENQSDISNGPVISQASPTYTEKNDPSIQQGGHLSPSQTQATSGNNLDSQGANAQGYGSPIAAAQGQPRYFLSPGAQKQKHNPTDLYGTANIYSPRTSNQPSLISNQSSLASNLLSGSYTSNSWIPPMQYSSLDKRTPSRTHEPHSQYPLSHRSSKNTQFMSPDGIFDHQAAHHALDNILKGPSIVRTSSQPQLTHSLSALSSHFAQYQSPRDLDPEERPSRSQELPGSHSKYPQMLQQIANTNIPSNFRVNPIQERGRINPNVPSSSQQLSPADLRSNRSRRSQSPRNLIEHTSSLPGLSSDRKIIQNLDLDALPPSKRIGPALRISPERRSANITNPSPNIFLGRYQTQTPDKSNASLVNRASPKLDNRYSTGSLLPVSRESQKSAMILVQDEPADIQEQNRPLFSENLLDRAPAQRPIYDNAVIRLKKETSLPSSDHPTNSKDQTIKSEFSPLLVEKKNWTAKINDESDVTDSRIESVLRLTEEDLTPRTFGNKDFIFTPVTESGRPSSKKDSHLIGVDEDGKFPRLMINTSLNHSPKLKSKDQTSKEWDMAHSRFHDLLKLDIEKFKKHIESGLFKIEEATDESIGKSIESGLSKRIQTQDENYTSVSFRGEAPPTFTVRAETKRETFGATQLDQQGGNRHSKGSETNFGLSSGRSDGSLPRELRADTLADEDRKIIKRSPAKNQGIESTEQSGYLRTSGDLANVEELNSITQKIKQDLARRREQNKKLLAQYSN